MCGRYTIGVEGTALPNALREGFNIDETIAEVIPTYNAAQTQTLPVVIVEEGRRRLERMRWSLIPRWQKPGHRALIGHNARSEEVETKPAFRHLVGRHRCLVPASGFYEWQSTPDNGRQPFYFSLQNEPLFAFAGLWDEWRNRDLPDEPPWRSFTILTTGPNSVVSPIHDRMPVILSSQNEAEWLSPDFTEAVQLEHLYQPYPDNKMQRWPVNRRVNTARENGLELILNSR